ncbi:MAG: ADP-ribose pyrophosphatase YjhB (NUDIX family) [Cryomorphaceae bacterium]|jgi:ADP-ribose pyrophosphatase YjhB (NUDIX family)
MWQPDVTVAAVCEKHGRFLLVEERSKSSQKIVFNQPAGHIEEGESVLAAVVRETLEETCCHFVPESLIGFYRYQAVNGKTYLRYTFCGSISDADSSYTLDPDIIRTHWLSLDAIRASASLRSPLVINCINDYLSGQRYPLDILREI